MKRRTEPQRLRNADKRGAERERLLVSKDGFTRRTKFRGHALHGPVPRNRAAHKDEAD